MKLLLKILVVLGLGTNLQAYTADCEVTSYETGEIVKFYIVVSKGIMIIHTSQGTHNEYFRGIKDDYFHYDAGAGAVYGDYETYLGKFKDGKFSYRSIGFYDDLSGTCTLR